MTNEPNDNNSSDNEENGRIPSPISPLLLPQSKPKPAGARWMQVCPKCHQKSGLPLLEQERDASEHPDVPPGVSGVTPVECQNPECQEAWQMITHRQVLRGLSTWNGVSPQR